MQISFRLEENLIQRTTVNQAGTYDMMRHHLYKNIKFTINKKRRKKRREMAINLQLDYTPNISKSSVVHQP